MMLRKIVAIQDQPGIPAAIASVVKASHGKVCKVCGLERMGHAPESVWLGYESHEWAGRPATAGDLILARDLTSKAYKLRPSQNVR